MMKCELVFDDWRKAGVAESIYYTELGNQLSNGDLHSGTVSNVEVSMPKYVEQELKRAWDRHQAYAVFRLVPRSGRLTKKRIKKKEPRCEWKDDEDGNWHTQCKNSFSFEDGVPSANGMKFCCYCGKILIE